MRKTLHHTAKRRRRPQPHTARGRRWVEGKDVCLADEVQYIQRRAAERDSHIVTIGPLLLFSTESGDAWILDPAEHLATRVAEAGDPRPVHLEETDTSFAVGWRGRYEISGSAFVFSDDDLGRVTTIMGCPIREITARISEVFGYR